jgi:hypothetical protein
MEYILAKVAIEAAMLEFKVCSEGKSFTEEGNGRGSLGSSKSSLLDGERGSNFDKATRCGVAKQVASNWLKLILFMPSVVSSRRNCQLSG